MLSDGNMCFLIAVLILASIFHCQMCQPNCSKFVSPPPTCPGDQLIYYCTTYDWSGSNTGDTVWTVSSQPDPCVLKHVEGVGYKAECGSFQNEIIESSDGCFKSILNSTASLALVDVQVACYFRHGTTPHEVGKENMTIVGPVKTTSISCGEIQSGKSNLTRNLTINWKTTKDFPNKISRYVISVLPPVHAEVKTHEVEPGSRNFSEKQFTVELKLGTEYQLKVRTDNCEGKQAGENASITVLLNVPDPPCAGDCVRRVDRITCRSEAAKLHALDITVDIVDPSTLCTPGPIENITIYFSPQNVGDPVTFHFSNKYCNRTKKQCFYTYNFSSDLRETQFDVQVTASNSVGESLPFQFPISSANASLTAKISSVAAPYQAQFFLSDGFDNLENCSFIFGMDDMYINLTERGVRNVSSSNTEILFDFDGLLNNSTYNYNMSCDVTSNATNYTLVIQGTFRSSCSEAGLVNGSAGGTEECTAEEEGYKCLWVDKFAQVVFNNSTAVYYVMNKDYCLSGRDTRMCMSDGYWDGKEPLFQKVNTGKKMNTWTILWAIVFLLVGLTCLVQVTTLITHASSAIIGFIAVVVGLLLLPVSVIIYWILRKKRDEGPQEGQTKWFLKVTVVVIAVMLVLFLIIHVVLNSLYSDGYTRDDSGICKSTANPLPELWWFLVLLFGILLVVIILCVAWICISLLYMPSEENNSPSSRGQLPAQSEGPPGSPGPAGNTGEQGPPGPPEMKGAPGTGGGAEIPQCSEGPPGTIKSDGKEKVLTILKRGYDGVRKRLSSARKAFLKSSK